MLLCGLEGASPNLRLRAVVGMLDEGETPASHNETGGNRKLDVTLLFQSVPRPLDPPEDVAGTGSQCPL